MDVGVNLAIKDGENFEDAVALARKSGLRVTQAFDTLGIASGRIDSTKLASLHRLPGIIVEEDRAVGACEA